MKKKKKINVEIIDLGITEEHLREDTLMDEKEILEKDECLFEKLDKVDTINKSLSYIRN